MSSEHTASEQIPREVAAFSRDSWMERNSEGLALAAKGLWPDATRAFEAALESLDAIGPDDSVTLAARDVARAKILLNLAQSSFYAGAFEEARRSAERSCAIRVGLYGEDSLVVARTRTALAVILESLGERDEARSLRERATAATERKREGNNASTPIAVPVHSFKSGPLASASDDQLLRSAIAATAELLHSTPAANVAVNLELDDAIFDLIEPPPPTLSAFPAAQRASVNPLGFEVQYGIPAQLHEPLDATTGAMEPGDASAALESRANSDTPATQPIAATRPVIRAVGGIRRGSTQVMAPKRLLIVTAMLLAFGAGVAFYFIVLPLFR
jgi:tetratricopeptide (TPR) repeat protein